VRNFLLPGLLLLLAHSTASAQGILQLQFITPAEATTSTGSLDVEVEVTSSYTIESVTARSETLSAPLQKVSTTRWRGRVEMGSLAWGPHTLTVQARDVNGQTAEVSRSFNLDRLPAITLTRPAWETAASSTLLVEAACQDDDPGGCVGNLEVQVVRFNTPDSTEPVLASGTQSLSTTVDLSTFGDGTWWLIVRFRPEGSTTSKAFASRRIYVAKPPLYEFVGEATYPLIDFDAERFLATRDAEEFILQRRSTGTIELQHTVTEGPANLDLRVGALTLNGALFRGKDNRTYEWKETDLINHDRVAENLPFGFIVQGPWIALKGQLRNEATGQVWTPPYSLVALSPRGEVACVSGEQGTRGIYGFKEGVVRRVGTPSYGPNGYLKSLATDGYHYVWVENYGVRSGEGVSMAAGGVQQGLASGGGGFGSYPGRVIVNEGYIAFSRGELDRVQVILRRPDGMEVQLSFFSQHAVPEAVSPTGEVLLTSVGRRYLGRPGSTPLELGPEFGRLKLFQGEWYLMVGRGLFRLVLPPGERPAPGPVWTPPPGQWDSDDENPPPAPGDDANPGEDAHSCSASGASASSPLVWAGLLALLSRFRWLRSSRSCKRG
jgi:hypothetical protein